jgi:hypothetical protein
VTSKKNGMVSLSSIVTEERNHRWLLSLCGTMQRSLSAWQLCNALESFAICDRTFARIDPSNNSFDQRAFDDLADFLLKDRVLAYV